MDFLKKLLGNVGQVAQNAVHNVEQGHPAQINPNQAVFDKARINQATGIQPAQPPYARVGPTPYLPPPYAPPVSLLNVPTPYYQRPDFATQGQNIQLPWGVDQPKPQPFNGVVTTPAIQDPNFKTPHYRI